MKNIVLVGFMGTGKTVTAKLLAKRLKLSYISIDDLIEKKEKRLISEIFEKDGEEYFRNIESETIKEISQRKNIVIDAGGGAVIKEENISNLKKNGIIICLKASPDVILARTKTQSHRPLLKVADLEKKVMELLACRAVYYAKADFTIDTSGLAPDEVAKKIEEIAL